MHFDPTVFGIVQLFCVGCVLFVHAVVVVLVWMSRIVAGTLLSMSGIVLVTTLLLRSYISHVPQNRSPIPCFIRAPSL